MSASKSKRPAPFLLPPNIHETVNPAAYGWSMTDDSGSVMQVAWPRDTTYLLFAMKGAATGTWTTTMTLARPRWSVDGTLDDARRVAIEFLTSPQS